MRIRSLSKLPVLIRFEGEGNPKSHNWYLRDLVAIFPTLPGTNSPQSMQCYSSVGQLSSCDEGYIRSTKKPTHEQVEAMLAELARIGYPRKDLNVLSRVSRSHHERRRRVLNESYRF